MILEGIRVLELSNFISGPYTAMLLGDLGAEVIKIETPGQGDPFRGWGEKGISSAFFAYNRGKKSITLNLRNSSARDVFYRLVETADVLVENNRPGVSERLGMDYDRLQAINPRLIYCSITAFGADGPYALRPGYDTVAQGITGMLGLYLTEADAAIRGPAVADSLTGLTATYGILGALVKRGISGRGCRVETSMVEAMMSFLCEPFSFYYHTGTVPGPYSRPQEAQAYGLRCSDGKRLAIHLSSPQKFFTGLLQIIGRPELAEDPRFATRNQRVEHYQDFYAILQEAFARHPRDYWLTRLEAQDVPHTPVYAIDEVLNDPQVRHLQVLGNVPHPVLSSIPAVRNPLRYDGVPMRHAGPPPLLGEHTEAIIASLGYTAADIAELTRSGAFEPTGH